MASLSSSSAVLKLTCVMLMCMVIVAPYAEAEIPCPQIAIRLTSCISYLRTRGGPVPPACCSGIKSLNNEARTTPDRQAACRCIKSTSAMIRGLNYGLASRLPSLCRVSIPYKISPTTDCNKVR